MIKVVAVNGKGGCGKTTFEEMCQSLLMRRVYITSMVTYVKEVARFCGWNGEKSELDRRFLSDIKDALTRYHNIPYRKIKNELNSFIDDLREYGVEDQDAIFFVDSREPNDLQHLRDSLDATCLLIRRPEVDDVNYNNHADDGVFDFNYDYIINNNGDIDDLYESCKKFIADLFKE